MRVSGHRETMLAPGEKVYCPEKDISDIFTQGWGKGSGSGLNGQTSLEVLCCAPRQHGALCPPARCVPGPDLRRQERLQTEAGRPLWPAGRGHRLGPCLALPSTALTSAHPDREQGGVQVWGEEPAGALRLRSLTWNEQVTPASTFEAA